MSKKYSEAMEKVYVTEDMHKRIIENIKNTDFDRKKHNFAKRIIPLAACFAVAAVGVLTVPKMIQQPSQGDIVQGTGQIAEAGSAAELSDMLGFEITAPEYIPFEAGSITYTSFWNEIGEIDFADGENSLCYRKGLSKDGDVSGDYNVYDTEKIISLSGTDITIKGNGGEYNLAVWSKGEYSYSVYISYGINENEIENIVKSID